MGRRMPGSVGAAQSSAIGHGEVDDRKRLGRAPGRGWAADESGAQRGTNPSSRDGFDRQDEAVERFDPDAVAWLELLAVRDARLPELAVDEDEPVSPYLAHRAGNRLRADLNGAPAYLPGLPHRKGPDRPERDGEADHQRFRGAVRRRRVVEEHDRADGETDQPGDRERSVARDVQIDHEQRDAEQDQ